MSCQGHAVPKPIYSPIYVVEQLYRLTLHKYTENCC